MTWYAQLIRDPCIQLQRTDTGHYNYYQFHKIYSTIIGLIVFMFYRWTLITVLRDDPAIKFVKFYLKEDKSMVCITISWPSCCWILNDSCGSSGCPKNRWSWSSATCNHLSRKTVWEGKPSVLTRD